MRNITLLFNDLDELISSKAEKIKILPSSKLYKLLDFFMKNGNSGINALRELVQEYIDDIVEVFFEFEGKHTECHICLCYEYHDIVIIRHINDNDVSQYYYEIVDKSRKDIESIKKEFQNLDL